ncbi:hypothetical protein VEHSUH05_00975 [Veillonella denticariosi JCM 15641]|uniref:Uncharacterized protein n=1 Tax=Veillonella denticariosi JCM 15641 TaxID=1298594 RepID=A0A2S7ZCS2_9FIRM|nr:hypothetical protein [Veillonella denticariosi]PQL21025.1 hypothetical protein VEHSUH05_00975 [Veillonella denticariosi JCM 15641]
MEYRGLVFVPRTTGEAIINAYAMNAWNDTGKYIYFQEDGISVGIHTTDDGIYINSFMDVAICAAWLNGEISITELKEVEGIYTNRTNRVKENKHE